MNAAKKPSGSFFNPVPDNDNDDDVSESNTNDNEPPQNQQNNSSSDLNSDSDTQDDVDKSLQKLMQDRQRPSLASQPSTINGIPTSQAGVGFGGSKSQAKKKQKQKQKQSSYTAIGTPDLDDDSAKSAIHNNGFANKPLNDVTRPEYDDQGYTLYADEETGEKSRVFEALVDYPCKFTMKIVGANEGTFVEEILQVVADSCNVDDVGNIQHKTRTMGKWTSVTVRSKKLLWSITWLLAFMLYLLCVVSWTKELIICY